MSRKCTIDEKDINYGIPEPELNHNITCKQCNKTSEVSRKYTRLCDKCRNSRKYRNMFDPYDNLQTSQPFQIKKGRVLRDVKVP